MDAAGKTLLLYPARRAGADLVIDENVTAIADYAFAYCQNLRSITIGTQVETIGDHAFEAVNDALCLVVQDGSPVQLWASAHGVRHANQSTTFTYHLEGDKAYITGYTGEMSDVVVPAVIDGHPVYAIENLRGSILKHVVVSEGIEVIGDGAFNSNGVDTLESISLPQSVKKSKDLLLRTGEAARSIAWWSCRNWRLCFPSLPEFEANCIAGYSGSDWNVGVCRHGANVADDSSECNQTWRIVCFELRFADSIVYCSRKHKL